METLTPSEVISFRAECYRNLDGKGVFSLYSQRSELFGLFRDSDNFHSHFKNQARDTAHAGLKIVAERTRGNMSEVSYIEYIQENDSLLSYYSKSTLVFENNGWKILKEQREVRKNSISVNI